LSLDLGNPTARSGSTMFGFALALFARKLDPPRRSRFRGELTREVFGMAAGFGPIFGGRRPADIAREVFGRPRRHHRWWLDWAVRDRAVCICVIAVDLRGMGGSESSSRLKPDQQRRSFMTQAICVITGVGPGTGSALARFASGGYRVAMIARDLERLSRLEHEVPGSKGYACDVSDASLVEATADVIEREFGAPDVVVHNAVGDAFGTFLEIAGAMRRSAAWAPTCWAGSTVTQPRGSTNCSPGIGKAGLPDLVA
jgi:hypothetical protein